MGQITSGIGLISGLDIGSLVDQLISLETQGRTNIAQQNTVLTATQTAYQTVNARLLSLRSAAEAFNQPLNFRQTSSNSSNEDVLSISSSSGAIPGNFDLRVRQLVAAQQTLSRGFADADATAFGQDTTLTFERGAARLNADTNLDQLNGGEGIDRGLIRITDRSGNSELIDLSDAVTVNDAIETINSAVTVSVQASVDGDGLVLADTSGFTTSSLRVQNVGLTETASGLGLAGTAGGNTLTGTSVNTIGDSTALARLNDGLGIGKEEGLDDLRLTDRAGNTYNLNLDTVQTLGDLADQIDEDTDGALRLTYAADGVSLALVDRNGGGGNLQIEALNDSTAAEDLGLLGSVASDTLTGNRVIASINSRSLRFLNGGQGLAAFGGSTTMELNGRTQLADLFAGGGLTTNGTAADDLTLAAKDDAGTTFGIDLDAISTVQELIDEVDEVTGGRIALSLSGDRLIATDTTEGAENFTIADGVGASVATELGIAVDDDSVSTISGAVLDPQVTDLGAQIQFTDSSGASATLNFASAGSISDILAQINESGLGLEATINSSGGGIQIQDTAGGIGDLVIADAAGSQLATQMGLVGTFRNGEADTGLLRFGFVRESSLLDDLGVTRGKFTLTDSSGASAVVDLTQGDEVNIQDVIDEINSRGLLIEASVNETGNGLTLTDTNTDPPIGAITIEEDGSTTASDLGILGVAESNGGNLFGSFTTTIDIDATDTLSDIAGKISDSNANIAASVIRDGSAGTPFRLSLTARNPGSAGAFVFDDGGLGLNTFELAEARDAVVFLGAGGSNGESVTITSSSNTLDEVLPGVTINLLATSDQPVQVTVSDNPQAVKDLVSSFVDGFNGLMDTIDEFDAYDAETEQRGLLLGDPAVNGLKQQLFNAVFRQNNELSQELNSLTEIGVKIASGARLTFDESKFDTAYAQDPESLVNMFTLRQTEDVDGDGEADVDEDGETIVSARGFGAILDELFERLTDSEFGPIEAAISRLQAQVANNESRIETIDERLESRRTALTAEFIAMEQALSLLQNQSSALGNIQALQLTNTTGGSNN